MAVMKKFLLLILFISSLNGRELDWINDYDEALILAKKYNKDVYLFIGADRCRFCDILKEKALSKKPVLDRLNEQYIPIYLSRDRHKIPSKFETKGVPRHYFLANDGKIIHEDAGFREENGFNLMLDEVELLKD